MSLPHFTGEDGICAQLEEVVGMVEGLDRWNTFLEGGSRTAEEFLRAWGCMRL
jgi:hypothetical protein